MKKYIFLLALFCAAVLTAQSQDFKPFRVDGGLGSVFPFAKTMYPKGELSLGTSLGFYVEPKYEITRQIALGFRWEGVLFAGEYSAPTGAPLGEEAILLDFGSAYLLTGDYYFWNKTFRPFVGLGLGLYKSYLSNSYYKQSIETLIEGKTKFGGMLRTGFDICHFRFTAAYNYAGAHVDETHQHYLTLTAGFYIGGGKKK